MIVIGKLEFEDIEDVEEYFEEQFFEIKQQLQSKPLLRATSKQRMKQLQDLQAFEPILELDVSEISLSIPEFTNRNIAEAWELFSSAFSKWKLKCANAITPTELLQLLELGFDLQKKFYQLIPEIDWKEEDPKVGVVEQLMNLQNGFNLLKTSGLIHFEDLSKVPFAEIKANDTLYLFFLELKRLSLRSQYV